MKLRHYDHDGRARFVTFCTHRRQPVLTNDQYRGLIAQAITAERNDSGFSLLAYVFMPERAFGDIPEGGVQSRRDHR